VATGRKKAIGSPRPSEEAHRQVVELLELGERSSNPEIRNAAIEIAKNTSANQRAVTAQLRPATIVVLSTLVISTAVVACWYALTHYPGSLARSITEVVIAMSMTLIALYALLSGHLSQDNFMRMVTSVWSWGKGLISKPPNPIEQLPAPASAERSSSGNDQPPNS
jgi:hypothetical protein